jgi:AcrR family transcriptional regulator
MSDVSELTHIIPPQQERSTRFLMRVLEAAERILRRDGADGLTMPAVALEAGVSVGGIYRRFQTKQDLLRAIKDRHLSRSEQVMATAMEGDLRSLGEVVRVFVTTLIRDSGPGSESLFGLIMESQGDDSVMHARGQTCVERQRQSFARAVAPFRHEITHPDPDLAIDMAFLIAISVFTRRVKKRGQAGPPASWSDLRRELARAMTAYLQAPAA